MRARKIASLIVGVQVGFFLSLILSGFVLAVQNTPIESTRSDEVATQEAAPLTQAVQPAPATGSLQTGVYITNPDPSYFEESLSHNFSILAWFSHWNHSIDSEKLRRTCTTGYLPQITWESRAPGQTKSSDYTLEAIARGDHDTYIREQLQIVTDTCNQQEVIIRFNHEMDTPVGRTDWYPWQGAPDDYILAWQHVVTLGREINPRIKWLWSPNRGTETTKRYYPGDEFVDYVGITINRNPEQKRYTSFSAFYGDNRSVIESFGKPIIISETTYDEAGGSALEKQAWIESMGEYLLSDQKIVAVSWFGSREGQAFDSSELSARALQAVYIKIGEKND